MRRAVKKLRGLEQRLRRNAAGIQAGSAESAAPVAVFPLVDARDLHSVLRGANRSNVSGGTGPDDDYVETSAHFISLASRACHGPKQWSNTVGSNLQQQARRVLQSVLDRNEELYGLAPVDNPVIVGQRHEHHRASLDLAIHDHWPLLDRMHA